MLTVATQRRKPLNIARTRRLHQALPQIQHLWVISSTKIQLAPVGHVLITASGQPTSRALESSSQTEGKSNSHLKAGQRCLSKTPKVVPGALMRLYIYRANARQV